MHVILQTGPLTAYQLQGVKGHQIVVRVARGSGDKARAYLSPVSSYLKAGTRRMQCIVGSLYYAVYTAAIFDVVEWVQKFCTLIAKLEIAA